jgi:hypothetical protein
MSAYRSLVVVLALSVPFAACDKEGGTAKCPEPTSTPAAGGGAALDAELVKTASAGAIKMKIRTDASGALVKQSVYHRDQAAIPKPVHDLAAQKFPGGKTEQVESELYREHGRVYEVEVTTADGKKCEVAASAEGVELYTECVVEPASLPAPVTAAIAKLYPDAKVLEAETKKGPKVDEITVEVQVGDGEHYVRIEPDGTVIERLVRVPAVVEIPVP